MAHLRRFLLGILILPFVYGSAVLSQEIPTEAAPKLFAGCADRGVIPRANNNPRERMFDAAKKIDPITKRVFKSFKLEEVANVDMGAFNGLCWSRIDGLWQEQMAVGFDSSVKADGWAGMKSGMDEFAHGTYTTPVFLTVTANETLTSLTIKSALGPGQPIRFKRINQMTIEDIAAKTSNRILFQSEQINGRSEKLSISISGTGHMRIKMGEREFRRPRPELSKYERAEQVPSNDIFAIAYNAKNLVASRQGYDVTTQNPDRFLSNGGKLEIFARAKPRDYYLAEQMTVPLGLSLVEEGIQGTVFFERLLSSESEYQKATASSFGVNAGLSGGVGGEKKKNGRTKKGTDTKISASIGYQNAKEEVEGMKEQHSVASMDGYQRFKKYALVRDHAFSALSDNFYDAIEDAFQSGNYQRVIQKFGTHYSYAATFGAAGRLQTYMTEDTISNNARSFTSEGGSSGLKLGPLDFSVTKDSSSTLTTGNSTTTKFGTTVFTGVGGNGSWDQSGFVAGDTPYPILMDLRRLDELLNPIYFPEHPEIYNEARTKLSGAITDYLYGKAQLLSTKSLLANIEPKQTIVIKLTGLQCLKAGSWEGKGNELEIHGVINLRFPASRAVFGPDVPGFNSKRDTKEDFAVIRCPGGIHKITHRKSARQFEAKASQLAAARWEIHLRLEEWDWGLNAIDGQELIRSTARTGLRIPTLAVGQRKNVYWNIPPNTPGMPKLRVIVQFRRKK